MARGLTFELGDKQIPVTPEKLDRSKLYGSVETESLDEQGRPCTLVTLTSDGRTLVGRGGSGFAILSQDGAWLERSALKPVDNQGNPVQPVASSFSAPIRLEKVATIEEYMSHDIRLVYEINLEGEGAQLLDRLRAGTIYQFPYSFRGGPEADVGFVLCNNTGDPFLVVGVPTAWEFVGLAQAQGTEGETESPESPEETDELDFSMM